MRRLAFVILSAVAVIFLPGTSSAGCGEYCNPCDCQPPPTVTVPPTTEAPTTTTTEAPTTTTEAPTTTTTAPIVVVAPPITAPPAEPVHVQPRFTG